MPYSDPVIRKEFYARYKREHREEISKKEHSRYVANRDKRANQTRAWRERNREAFNANAREWRANNPEKSRAASRRWYLKNQGKNADRNRTWKFGTDGKAALAKQGGKCAICGIVMTGGNTDRTSAHLDHDHETGRVRGWLCHHCNIGVGMFRDTPEFLIAAANYLRKFGNQGNDHE